MAEIVTRTSAVTWMACDSPKGCVPLRAEPGSPVEIYGTVGEWTCGYGIDRHGAGSAWFRSRDLHRLEFRANPPLAAWYGTWKGGEDHVVISPAKNRTRLHLVGKAMWQGGNGNEHFGNVRGDASPAGNRLHYVEGGCTIDLTLAGKYILAYDNQGCGGMNARFGGIWKHAHQHRLALYTIDH